MSIEQSKLDNLKAQYRSLLSSIQDTSEELGRLLDQNEQIRREGEVLERERNSLAYDVSRLHETHQNLQIEITAGKKKVKGLEEELQSIKKKIDAQTNSAESELSRLNQKIANKREAVGVLVEEERNLKTTVKLAKEEAKELVTSIDGLSKDKSSLRRELDEMVAEYQKAKNSSQRELQALTEAISQAIERRKLEEGKFVEVKKYIQEKEHNLDVLTRRLKKLYREIKPGVELKI